MTEQTVLNTASMLMSKQLRGSCEASLRLMEEFFKRFRSEFASGDSAFRLELKVNEEYVSGARVPLVTIEPSLERLQSECCKCVELIVRGAQKFPRAESAFPGEGVDASGGLDGGGGGGLPPDGPEKLYMGPAIINGPAMMNSEIVMEVKATIRAELEHHYNGPLSMLKKFDPFGPLAGGETEGEG